MNTIFTLAPSGHPKDPTVLEHSYKLWSTFAMSKDKVRIFVRSNKQNTAGGQSWHVIATSVNGTWYVGRGEGFLGQGGALLSRYLISKRGKVRSAVQPFAGKVRRYKATAKVYSLPSILNGMQAVVSRDKLADKRSAERKTSLADMIAARAERTKEGSA